jgi:hypothetical protein
MLRSANRDEDIAIHHAPEAWDNVPKNSGICTSKETLARDNLAAQQHA